MNWMTIQTLARSMSTLHKQLIVVDVVPVKVPVPVQVPGRVEETDVALIDGQEGQDVHVDEEVSRQFRVDEMAIASGHAPFRHRKDVAKVGGQVKKSRVK